MKVSVGVYQLCVGQGGGYESAIHALHCFYQLESTEDILLVDERNALNTLNYQVTPLSILHICPSIFRNSY